MGHLRRALRLDCRFRSSATTVFREGDEGENRGLRLVRSCDSRPVAPPTKQRGLIVIPGGSPLAGRAGCVWSPWARTAESPRQRWGVQSVTDCRGNDGVIVRSNGQLETYVTGWAESRNTTVFDSRSAP